jgi:hypothetical protein
LNRLVLRKLFETTLETSHRVRVGCKPKCLKTTLEISHRVRVGCKPNILETLSVLKKLTNTTMESSDEEGEFDYSVFTQEEFTVKRGYIVMLNSVAKRAYNVTFLVDGSVGTLSNEIANLFGDLLEYTEMVLHNKKVLGVELKHLELGQHIYFHDYTFESCWNIMRKLKRAAKKTVTNDITIGQKFQIFIYSMK